MQATHNTKQISKHAEPDFEQELLFTYYEEQTTEEGKCISRELTREVLIDYIGIRDALHKYQICCTACDIVSKRNIDASSELFMAIDFVFTLVVVSADSKGNLAELHNFDFLQQEWLDLRNELIQDYDQKDTASRSLINDMDTLMQDYTAVVNYLKSADMYGLFFNGYWEQSSDHLKPFMNKMQYGKELQYTTVKEIVHTTIQQSDTQQFVHIAVKNDEETAFPGLIHYAGAGTYIDGALNTCQKKIDLGSRKFNYSVRWVGLKKRFQV